MARDPFVSDAVGSDEIGRRRATALAGHRRDVAALRAALADTDPGVRATALSGLRRAGDLTAQDLATAVADASPAVRRRAAELVAGASGDARAPVVPLTYDSDATVVEVAAWALGELDPPEAGSVSRLSSLATDHDDPLVREAAVAALGSLGSEAGLPAILEAMNDKATIRRRATLALAPFDGPDITAALETARTDRDAQVRQAAEDLLATDCDRSGDAG